MTASMQAEGAPAPIGHNIPPTFIDFLLDETGSMSSCEAQTKSGFDIFVSEQQKIAGDCYLTLTKFDSTSLRTPYENLPIAMVPSLTFYPGAGTNLYDCIGDRLTIALDHAHRGNALFVIMTDGDDNQSRRHTVQSARDLVERAQSCGITVVYFGPSDRALTVGSALGIPSGNIKPFDTSRMSETMADFSNATTAFRAGATASTDFFS